MDPDYVYELLLKRIEKLEKKIEFLEKEMTSIMNNLPYKLPEGEWDPWGRLEDGHIWSVPRKYSLYEAIDSNLTIGHCKCCSEQPCGHVFKKSDFPSGKVRYKCICCGLESTLIFDPVSTESEDKK